MVAIERPFPICILLTSQVISSISMITGNSFLTVGRSQNFNQGNHEGNPHKRGCFPHIRGRLPQTSMLYPHTNTDEGELRRRVCCDPTRTHSRGYPPHSRGASPPAPKVPINPPPLVKKVQVPKREVSKWKRLHLVCPSNVYSHKKLVIL